MSKRRSRLIVEASENVRHEGVVKWFSPTKGFGFIQSQGGGEDVFVHISAVESSGMLTLNAGQSISYEVVEQRDGRFAATALEAVEQSQRPGLSVVSPTLAHKGVLKWFNGDKGYGFILPSGGGKDVFLLYKVIEAAGLNVDEFAKAADNQLKLSYDAEKDPFGRLSAVRVRIEHN